MESLALRDVKPEGEEEEQKQTFIAFARIYSGVVRKKQKVFVLGPKYDPGQGLSLVTTHHLHLALNPGPSLEQSVFEICP